MSGEQIERLRDLLEVPNQESQQALDKRVDGVEQRLEHLPDQLPAALRSADSQGPNLATALEHPVAKAVESLARNRRELLANALFPVLGPAIRQAITDALRGLVENLNRLLESTFSVRGLRWRMESWRSGMPYAQVALRHMLRYSVDHLFVIQNGSGLLLAQAHQFEAQANDSDAVAAMLTAIRDFMRDSGLAPGEAELRQVELGEHLLRLYPGPDAYLAAAISGVPGRDVDESLSELLELMHRQLPQALQEGENDLQVAELLNRWFSHSGRSQELDEEQQGRPIMALALIGVLLLTGLVWGAERWWTGREAASLGAVLAAEPGYQVQTRRSGWRKIQVSGLRDPIAAPMAEMVQRVELDAERVYSTLQPYLSLQPALLHARLEALLQPPDGVSIRSVNGVLRIEGEADAAWLGEAQQRAQALAAVATLQWHVHSETEPPPPDPLPAVIEVELSQGAELDQDARSALAQVVGWFAPPANPDPRLRVQLIAETDGVGDLASNQQLAEARLQAVREVLLELGLAEQRLLPGIARPEVVSGEDFRHRRVKVEAVIAQ